MSERTITIRNSSSTLYTITTVGAFLVSYALNASFWWALLHAFLGWWYLLYAVITSGPLIIPAVQKLLGM